MYCIVYDYSRSMLLFCHKTDFQQWKKAVKRLLNLFASDILNDKKCMFHTKKLPLELVSLKRDKMS